MPITRGPAGLLLAGAILSASLPCHADAEQGWATITFDAGGGYARRYLPAASDPTEPVPVVVFLHGSGGRPELYESYVEAAAEAAGCALLLPKSADALAWGTEGDEAAISSSLAALRTEINIDEGRLGIAGHSAGGAYAYLLAYGTLSRYCAVFTLAAPYYPVEGVRDDRYTAPIRMYYGTEDPNHATARPALVGQWLGLAVEFEQDIQPGYGHNTWPASSMEQGLLFLVNHTYPLQPGEGAGPCRGSDTVLCLRGGRFQVTVDWRTADDRSGAGHVVAAGSTDSGLFWFFDENNWELLVKVLDGCALTGHHWVFSAATTNVEYTLSVVDLESGSSASYFNPLGVAAPAITDTTAVAACP